MSTFDSDITAIVGQNYVLTEPDDLSYYGNDSSNLFTPYPRLIVKPANTDQIAQIVSLANKHQIAVIPSGGRTGLSGGAVAINNEIVISLERLNKITNYNAIDKTVDCDAGVITQQLQKFAEQQSLFYPIDFASSGSSQIGGNIATNAGGIKVIKYGLTRNWVAGLTVVTPLGEVLELNQGLVKNATGFDLRHLMIGSEGTLGIITKATMKLTSAPINPTVMLLAIKELADISHLLKHFQSHFELLAFEFFSHKALEKVVEYYSLKKPLEKKGLFYLLIEFEVINHSTLEKILSLFQAALDEHWLIDGVISQSQQQVKDIWQYREGISEAINHFTPYKYDIAVVPSKIEVFLIKVDQFIKNNYPNFEIIWFGHIGDGNLHLNILKPSKLSIEKFKQQCEIANQSIYSILKSLKGSISAEHGIGLVKKDYLMFSRSVLEIELMKAIKHGFDPNNIMNPGKLIANTSSIITTNL